ncbi:hypothetical protein MJ1_0343 [Nanobdella aerobiophila]|uniref:Uncharacterized protein n=1 Tax=Nanobdella aerobiophila TaxID=2586965 RepID=A0A915WSS2_9ARCH|nr:hypothetical protein [Nanobdella aerobiophila]BBL45507.1 hypothetical protein MJ1_0343 [Nanobdella aerobiophila]
MTETVIVKDNLPSSFSFILVDILSEIENKDILDQFLENLLKKENLIDAIKNNLYFFLIIFLTIILKTKITILNIDRKMIENKYDKILPNIQDKLERDMLKIIFDIDLLKYDYLEKFGLQEYIKKFFEKPELQKILIDKQLEIMILYLLYKKNKERVLKYDQYIKDLLNETDLSLWYLYDDLIDYVSDKEEREIEEILKKEDLKNMKFVEYEL